MRLIFRSTFAACFSSGFVSKAAAKAWLLFEESFAVLNEQATDQTLGQNGICLQHTLQTTAQMIR